MDERDEKGRFVKGNPGKPRGAVHWQTRTLEEVAKVMRKQKNLKALGKHFQELFDKNPAGYFLKFVMPFLSKNIKLDFSDDIKEHGLPIEIIRERLLNALEQKRDDSSSDTDGQ